MKIYSTLLKVIYINNITDSYQKKRSTKNGTNTLNHDVCDTQNQANFSSHKKSYCYCRINMTARYMSDNLSKRKNHDYLQILWYAYFFVSFNGFIQIFWSLTCAIVATVKPKVKEYRTTSLWWADPQEKNVKIIVPINSANSLLITIRISLTSSRPTFGKILFIIIFFYNSVLMVWTKTCR